MRERNGIGTAVLRIGTMVVLPMLIVAAAALVAYRTTPDPPEQHRASAVIRPPSTVQDSAAAVNLFIVDISERIKTDLVVDHVLTEVPELDKETFVENVRADRRETSSSVALSFIHDDPAVAESTVDTLARRLLDDAARSDFERSEFLLNRATDRLNEAEASMSQLARNGSVYDPEVEYRSALDELAQLNRQITTGQALGYSQSYIDEHIARRSEVEASATRLGEALLLHEQRSTELQHARSAWEGARINYDRAEFEYRTVNAPANLMLRSDVAPFVDQTPRLQRTALAAATALALSLVTVVPLGAWLVRRRRLGRHRTRADRRISLIADSTPDQDLGDGPDQVQYVLSELR